MQSDKSVFMDMAKRLRYHNIGYLPIGISGQLITLHFIRASVRARYTFPANDYKYND